MISKSVVWLCGMMGLYVCMAESAEEARPKTGGGGWIAVIVVLLLAGAAMLYLRRGKGNQPGAHTPPQPVTIEPEPVKPTADREEASKLKEISEACERLGKLSNDMLKLYGGRDGIQRLRMLIKDAPQRQVKSVEEQLMETKIRQLAVLWREYKGIQARFADPAYDGPFGDPELEKAREARLRMLREPHENQEVYDALEQQAL